MIRNAAVALAAAMTMAGGATEAARPWQPNVTVRASEGVGNRRPLLDRRARQRLRQGYDEGQRLLRQGKYQAALAVLDQVVLLDPDHLGARIRRARALVTVGYLTWNLALIESARVDVGHALGIDPADGELSMFQELIDGLLRRMQAPPPHQR